jgi:hypothetical protein
VLILERSMLCKAAWIAAPLLMISAFSTMALAEPKMAYPQVRVELVPSYTPDAAFEKFRKLFLEAVAKKDLDALSALVAPGFVWTQNDTLSGEFDPGRDAQHNFRVVFGFRPPGKDADGAVEHGPFWNVLAAFANDNTLYQLGDAGNLVCSPATATIVNEEIYERAVTRVEATNEGAEWFFAVRPTPVAKAPDDKGPPIGKLGAEAFPIIGTHPEGAEAPTHYRVLLPSGRSGWIPADAARPLQGDRLCYALTASGEWKIGIYDSAAGE